MNLWLPTGAIALSAVLWGTWWIPLRILNGQGLPGDWASVAVYVMAAAVLSPVAIGRWRRFVRGGLLLLAVGASFGCMLFLWNRAVIVGDIVRATLLLYLTPVWATLLGRLVLKEAVGPLRTFSILAGLSGVAVVLGFPGESDVPLPRSEGDWLGLFAGVAFATSLTLARLGGTPRADGSPRELGGFEQSFIAFVVGAIGAFVFIAVAPLGTPEGGELAVSLPIAAGAALVWLLPQTFFCLWGAARLDPGRTSILLMLEVIAAAVSSTVIAGDVFTWRDGAGCMLILLAGVVEAESMRRQPQTA